jgi:hypothetical protein
MPDVSELHGLWRRSLIRFPDGSSDTTSEVHWLQGLQSFVDLRRPADLPSFAGRRGRDSLSAEDCATLALQQGFAGKFEFDGSHFEWRRHIDFQPKSGRADAGSLQWEQDVLVERGRDAPYTEHWHRDAAAPRSPMAAVSLCESRSGVTAILVRVGEDFMLARDRGIVLPAGIGLADCVAGARDSEQAREFIDCEIARGTVDARGFWIGQSSLPYRVGDELACEIRGSLFLMRDRAADGSHRTREWEVTACEGRIEALLRA